MLLFSSSIISTCQVLVNSFHFQTECCPNSVILIPWLYPCSFIFFWFLSSCFMSFNLQGSLNVPCSSFLTEFSSSFISVAFFLSTCSTSQGSLVSLVRQRSNFLLPLPLPFLPGDISRISGRDPLLVWESCDARDRRPRRYQKIPEGSRCSGVPVCFFCLCYLFFALHHVIMPSCHMFL